MSERGSGKSRKAPVPKAPASKTAVAKGAASKPTATKDTAARKAQKSARKGAASRASQKSASTTARQPKQSTGNAPPLDATSLLARVIRLESERDRLQAELATATSRIQALEESREQVVNRIDWVIDSLRNLIDD